MPLTLAEVRSQVYEAINSSKGVAYGTYDSNPNYKTGSIDDAIIDADYRVSSIICNTVGHPHRPLFVNTSSSLTTPGEWTSLVECDSAIEGVMIVVASVAKTGQAAPANKIQQWISNAAAHGGAAVIGGYYDVVGNQIFFSGTSLTYKYYKVPAFVATNLNSPVVYRPTVVRLALSFILAKDEAMMAAAQLYGQQAVMDLAAIGSGKIVVPEFEQAQQER